MKSAVLVTTKNDSAGGRWPPITVVTPVYNGARYIASTIESVVRQEYPGLQYIVLDDGSTDGTAAVLSDYNGAIEVVSHINAGETYTVNRGVALARHDIVCVVNADDPVLPGLLRAGGEALGADPSLSAVYPDWVWIDAEGKKIREVATAEFDLRVLLEQHLCIVGPGAMFRRSHLGGDPVRDPQRRTSADFDFWLRLGLRGTVKRLPMTLATWRQHASGTSAAACNSDMARDKVALIEGFFSRDDLPPEIRNLQRQALSAAYHNAGMLGLRSTDVPALSYFVKSYLASPVWPPDVLGPQRRSLPHMLYAATQPLSGLLHAALGPLLPDHWSRRAVLEQRFGVRHEP